MYFRAVYRSLDIFTESLNYYNISLKYRKIYRGGISSNVTYPWIILIEISVLLKQFWQKFTFKKYRLS